jgi:uncharacterized membrane protein
MTRDEYISTLKNALASMPEADISDIARDFEEHFDVGLSQGKTEHEISAELGDPTTVAQTYFEPGLQDIGHTMEENKAHGSGTGNTSSAGNDSGASTASVSTCTSGAPGASTAAAEKDLTGARLFVILFNILVMWWVVITVFSVLLSFWGISISLLVAAIAAFAAIPAVTGGWISVLVLAGIGGILLAAATGILNFFLSKWTVIGCRAYVNWNKKLYKEGF